MFEEEFEKLYESEKEEFKRVCNYLLSKTFVLRDVYDKQQKRMITSPEFLFMEKYYDIFENYLSYSGWNLTKDPINGIYKVENIYGYNKAKFDSFTTYILLALMLTYEEQAPIIEEKDYNENQLGMVLFSIQFFNFLGKIAQGLVFWAFSCYHTTTEFNSLNY